MTYVPDARRSELMSRIRRANTKPELVVRHLLHGLGYRFRVQLKGVPGRPDIAFTKRRKAIFINGCFWHAHEGCAHWRMPRSRRAFWEAKLMANRARDQRLIAAAQDAGWACLTIWECEMHDMTKLVARLSKYLGPCKLAD